LKIYCRKKLINYLKDNFMGDEGAKKIGEALVINNTLTELNLGVRL